MTVQSVPWDCDIEQAALGALMTDANAFWRIADVLEPESFSDPLHQRIFGLMAKYAALDRPLTPLTLAAALEDDPGLREVGGGAYLKSLARAAPVMPNLKDYAKTLNDAALRRRLVAIAAELEEGARASETDATALADSVGEELFDASRSRDPGEGPVELFDLMQRALSEAERAHNDPKGAVLTTGLPAVDKALGGLMRGRLTVLAADVGMGKSALAGGIALANAKGGGAALIFSLEMSGVEYAMRFMSEPSSISAEAMITGETSGRDIEALVYATNKIGKLPLRIDDTPNLSVAQMRARVQNMRRKLGDVVLVVVDLLRLVQPADRRADEQAQAMQVTRDLKAMAKDYNCAVLLVSHINREAKKRASHRPVLSDLFGASAIEQNADSVWFIFREEYYLDREPPTQEDGKALAEQEARAKRCRGVAEIFSAKKRMGKIATSWVRFNPRLTLFYEEAQDNPISEQETMNLAHG